jgi:hypothetical protein
LLSNYFNRIDANERFVAFSFSEFDQSVSESEQREIFSDADIRSGMVGCAALTNDNVACNCGLTAEDFNAKTFALRVAAVLYTTFTFFMSHILEYYNVF